MEVMITQPLVVSSERALKQRYRVHRYYDCEDKSALLAEIGERVRAIAGGKVDVELMDRLPNLEIISCFGVGYDSVDVQEATKRGIRVTNTPDVLNDAVAELAIGMMIALARRLLQADRFVREGMWPFGEFGLQAELTGRTLGILGLGRIGRELAARAQAMKMRVVYHGRAPKADAPFEYFSSLEEMALVSDWLVVLAPGGRDTTGIVSRRVLQALGPQGYLVNLARGSVVDQEALLDLLFNGGIRGAALDVFEHEPKVPEAFFGLENVLLSPHQGSGTVRARDLMGALLVANIDAQLSGRPVLTAVV
ncbi:2-hydroxyacid dehydrogenase [Devosia sp. D6-9]|nr:2-hydroxyacid dehydrogenase [Devosia sp. D6-9]